MTMTILQDQQLFRAVPQLPFLGTFAMKVAPLLRRSHLPDKPKSGT
jgi:hypothetical protein